MRNQTNEPPANPGRFSDQDIVRLRFGLDDGKVWTRDEVGEKYGLTGERIRQIEDKALAKLRRLDAARVLGDYLEES
jgi:RNA polymerase primary sigma factor